MFHAAVQRMEVISAELLMISLLLQPPSWRPTLEMDPAWWYESSSDLNNTEGLFYAASMYCNSTSRPCDVEHALELLRRSRRSEPDLVYIIPGILYEIWIQLLDWCPWLHPMVTYWTYQVLP